MCGENINKCSFIQASEPNLEKLSLKNTPKSDHKSGAELELEKLEAQLRTVRLALEILTGACATLPDPEADVSSPVPDEKDGDDGGILSQIDFLATSFTHKHTNEDWADDDGQDADMAMDDDASNAELLPATFLPVLVEPLLALIHPTSLSFPPFSAPSPHPPTTSALSAIHISALECLNNIFLSLATAPNPDVSSDKDSGRKVWSEVWRALSAVGTQYGLGQERRQEMWELAVGVLWGIGNVWKGTLVRNDNFFFAGLNCCLYFFILPGA